MRLFNKLLLRKKALSSNELEVTPSTKDGYIGEVERLANVVSAGLETENYSGMNKQLSIIAEKDEEKEVYVFEHPGVISRYYASVILIVFFACFAYFFIIGVGTSVLSNDVELNYSGIVLIGVSSIVLLTNIVLVIKLIMAIKFERRYEIYEELLGYKNWEFVEDIAVCAKQKEILVIQDLEHAIKQKLIPQGHLSRENHVLMVSNEVYNRYMEKPVVFDRYFQKIIEERRRVKSRTKQINQIMETGEKYIEKMRGYESLIKEKKVSREINRMEHVVSKIFRELDVNPNQVNLLGVFLNYYLPTTEKLLEAYVTIDENRENGKKATQTRKEIEEAIGTIIVAFEGILEKLYEECEMDIATDIAAMELSMKQDGLVM